MAHLGIGGHQLHVGFQELEAALLAEQHDEVAVGPTPAGLGVPVAAEQAVGDVQHPLLRLPPGPGCPGIRVLGLPLLHPCHILLSHQILGRHSVRYFSFQGHAARALGSWGCPSCTHLTCCVHTSFGTALCTPVSAAVFAPPALHFRCCTHVSFAPPAPF